MRNCSPRPLLLLGLLSMMSISTSADAKLMRRRRQGDRVLAEIHSVDSVDDDEMSDLLEFRSLMLISSMSMEQQQQQQQTLPYLSSSSESSSSSSDVGSVLSSVGQAAAAAKNGVRGGVAKAAGVAKGVAAKKNSGGLRRRRRGKNDTKNGTKLGKKTRVVAKNVVGAKKKSP